MWFFVLFSCILQYQPHEKDCSVNSIIDILLNGFLGYPGTKVSNAVWGKWDSAYWWLVVKSWYLNFSTQLRREYASSHFVVIRRNCAASLFIYPLFHIRLLQGNKNNIMTGYTPFIWHGWCYSLVTVPSSFIKIWRGVTEHYSSNTITHTSLTWGLPFKGKV